MSERYAATVVWLGTCAGAFGIVAFFREVILG